MNSTEAKAAENVHIGNVFHFIRQGLFVYLRPYWREHLCIVITVVILIAFEVALPLSLKFLIDGALVPPNMRLLIGILSLVGLLFVLSAIARFWQAFVRASVDEQLKKDLQITLFRHLQRTPADYFDRVQPGEITALFAKELMDVHGTLRELVIVGLSALLQFLAVIVTMFILNWRLALVVLAALPFMVIVPRRALKRAAAADYEDKMQDARVAFAVQDSVASQAVIQAFGLRDLMVERFAREVVGRDGRRRRTVKEGMKIPAFLERMVTVLTENQQALINALVIGGGAYLVFVDKLTIGAFSTFVLFLPQVGGTIVKMSDFLRGLISAASALERIERLMNAALPEVDETTSIPFRKPTQEIRFEGVHFNYRGDTFKLQNLTLSLPIGKAVAFVGRSGSGKSTLLKLLMRFYDPTAGQISVDGRDLREFDSGSLGAQMGVVLQKNILLNATIRENIRLVQPAATDAEIEAAAKAAGAHDFIMSLPDGYETNVGEEGKRLSEGQRQRIALARALLRQPPLLLLDEVTSALDPETEAAVNATIRRLAQDRTVILVTHRLSSVTFVDEVVVLDAGQVKEQGNHDELLARRGLYHQFWQMQTGFVISPDGHRAEVRGERLRAIPLFKTLDEATVNRFAEQFVSEYYPAGQVLYRQGDAGDRFYIVVRGTVSVSAMGANGGVVRLADLQDGDYFGEVEMLNRGRRTTTVQTKTPSLFLTLHAERFHAIMGEVASLQKVMKQMALGRSLTTISSVGRRQRPHPIWRELINHNWEDEQLPEKE